MRSLLLLDLTTAITGTLEADAVIVRADAHAVAGDTLPSLCARTRTFIDLGPIGTLAFDAALAAAAQAPIDGVALPACRCGADLQHLAAKLAVVEAESGRPDGTLGIVALVAGTAGAVLDVTSLVAATRRLRALLFDSDSLGAVLPPDGAPFALARALTLTAAKAAGVPAYDLLGASDVEACCRTARRDGFTGLFTSRPDAIPVINGLFPLNAKPALDA